MKVTVSFPQGDARWRDSYQPVLDKLAEKGVSVTVKSHRVIDVPDQPCLPGDDLPFVNVWMPGHAPGRATHSGVGITALRILEGLLEP